MPPGSDGRNPDAFGGADRWPVGAGSVCLRLGDITKLRADAIFNAASRQLAAGGGVDGAIHRAAGPKLQTELRRNRPRGCATGSAVVTAGCRLAARYVIHAVGPRWQGGRPG